MVINTVQTSSKPQVGSNETENHSPSPCVFYFFLLFVSGIFLLAALALIWWAERVRANNEPELPIEYLFTCLMAFVYFRLLTYKYAVHQLERLSPNLFVSMPEELANETAFTMTNVLSVFFWSPCFVYGIVQAYKLDESPQQFLNEYGGMIKLFSVIFAVDQSLQLYVAYDMRKFLHHFGECIVMILVLDWVPEQYRTPALLLICHEEVIVGKYGWSVVVLQRFHRQFAKTLGSDEKLRSTAHALLTPLEKALVWSNPKSLARYTLVMTIQLFIKDLIVTPTLFVVYQTTFWWDLHWLWKVAQPAFFLFFRLSDIPLYKSRLQMCYARYWSTEIFRRKSTAHRRSRRLTMMTTAHTTATRLSELTVRKNDIASGQAETNSDDVEQGVRSDKRSSVVRWNDVVDGGSPADIDRVSDTESSEESDEDNDGEYLV